jgi:DNA polymerase III subunit gamma/tau
MSYIVLARKYRPRNFTEMVGQEHVVQALSNALTQQRLHHAYLFTGTRGVGKTTVSRILAKSLNCQGPDGQGGITATPCGVCQACQDIDTGRFVDYTELDAASNRGVDEVQQLLEQAVYKPVQGRFKVFMIDEVHMLTNTAFNAMLKTLEEPPEYLKFVLATTDPQKVPVTVLSRCLQFNLRPMAPETVLEHLGRVLAAEQVPAELPALRLLSRAARGSMRDALSLTDQAIAFGSGQLQEAAVRLMLGAVDRSHVFRLLEALALGDGKTVVDMAELLRLHGVSAAATLEDMSAILQRMAVLQAVPERASAAIESQDPDEAETARLAALLPADETQLLYSICLHGRAELGLAPDEYAALTMVLLRLLAFKPATPVAATATPSAPAPVTTPVQTAAPMARPSPVPPAPLPSPSATAISPSACRARAHCATSRPTALGRCPPRHACTGPSSCTNFGTRSHSGHASSSASAANSPRRHHYRLRRPLGQRGASVVGC